MLSSQERLQKRQEFIKPLVEEFFEWVKEQIEQCSVPPKSKTGEELQFRLSIRKSISEYFLKMAMFRLITQHPREPCVLSAWEKRIGCFIILRMVLAASALVYSISETAKLNNLRPYYYFKYILTELPNFCDEQGNIDSTKLDDLMPWSDKLPEECRKPRR